MASPCAALVEEDALWRRAEECRGHNRYQRSFEAFLSECVWTKDEARGGRVAPFPMDDYIREACDIVMEESLTFWEKSRRTRITWFASALDLWVLGGGQDPRWPALMKSDSNRQVIIACRKLKGLQGSAWILNERVRFIYRQFEERGLREKWPTFPKFTFTFSHAVGSNGSIADAVPQGEDQCRGPGATFIHGDEISHWEQAKASVGAMLPCTLGGGRVMLIGTPNVDSFAKDLREGRI